MIEDEYYFKLVDDMRSILSHQAFKILKASLWKSVYEHAENIEKLEGILK